MTLRHDEDAAWLKSKKVEAASACALICELYRFLGVSVDKSRIHSYLHAKEAGMRHGSTEGDFFLPNQNAQIPSPWLALDFEAVLRRLSIVRLDCERAQGRERGEQLVRLLAHRSRSLFHLENGIATAERRGLWERRPHSADWQALLAPASFERYVFGMGADGIDWAVLVTHEGFALAFAKPRLIQGTLKRLADQGVDAVRQQVELGLRPGCLPDRTGAIVQLTGKVSRGASLPFDGGSGPA